MKQAIYFVCFLGLVYLVTSWFDSYKKYEGLTAEEWYEEYVEAQDSLDTCVAEKEESEEELSQRLINIRDEYSYMHTKMGYASSYEDISENLKGLFDTIEENTE